MKTILFKIRLITILFMVLLILSGITAFCVETELRFLLHFQEYLPNLLSEWLQKVYVAISETNARFPMLAYGFDWLAFAHIVIAVAFIGVLQDPVRNTWIITFGLIACILVFPTTWIFGNIRQIPFWWQIIDCSFGVFGLVPLLYLKKLILKLEKN